VKTAHHPVHAFDCGLSLTISHFVWFVFFVVQSNWNDPERTRTITGNENGSWSASKKVGRDRWARGAYEDVQEARASALTYEFVAGPSGPAIPVGDDWRRLSEPAEWELEVPALAAPLRQAGSESQPHLSRNNSRGFA
jgi:hypothetical protein